MPLKFRVGIIISTIHFLSYLLLDMVILCLVTMWVMLSTQIQKETKNLNL